MSTEAAALVEADVVDVGCRGRDRHGTHAFAAAERRQTLHKGPTDPTRLEFGEHGDALEIDRVGPVGRHQLSVADDLVRVVVCDEDTAEFDVAVDLLGRVVGQLEQVAQRCTRPVLPGDGLGAAAFGRNE